MMTVGDRFGGTVRARFVREREALGGPVRKWKTEEIVRDLRGWLTDEQSPDV